MVLIAGARRGYIVAHDPIGTAMATYHAEVVWSRNDAVFTDNRYSRAHEWRFDQGVVVPAAASPHIVPPPYTTEAAVDPEEAFVMVLGPIGYEHPPRTPNYPAAHVEDYRSFHPGGVNFLFDNNLPAPLAEALRLLGGDFIRAGSAAQMDAWQIAKLIVKAWDDIERFSASRSRPFMALIQRNGRVVRV